MTLYKPSADAGRKAQLLAELHRDVDLRQQGYRMRALKLFPHVCASCGRAFSGKRMRELTVHHKDRNHENNPPNGTNWELLCIYCHEDQHGSTLEFFERGDLGPTRDTTPPLTQRPFAKLAELMETMKKG